jgi:DNA helicase II / ATP-dependent DNA helicase PcrA
MQPSIYQQQVIDWGINQGNHQNSVVNSVAGAGKSTLLRLVAQAMTPIIEPRNCWVLVFNRKNKDALIKKLPDNWSKSIATVHSAGYRVLSRYLGNRRLDVREHKYRQLAQQLDWFNGSNPEQAKVISRSSFLKLAEFLRTTLSGTSAEALAQLIDHYGLDVDKQHLEAIGLKLNQLFAMGIEIAWSEKIVDYTDQLYLPLVWQINRQPGFNFAHSIMVDEAQDMSRLQLEFVLSLANTQTKMLFVGDPAQSINGFCGADTQSFERIKQRLQAQEFTLPICYRCPVSHIELINQLYPEIPIKQRDNAPPGKIEVIAESALWQPESEARVRPKDLIIARCTSTLVDLNLKLITRGIACNLVGSTLKQTLLELLDDIVSQPDFCYQEFLKCSQAYLEFKRSLYEANDNGPILLMQLQDKIKALKAIYQHFTQCQSIEELVANIERLFGSEDNEAVLLSTIHRAKGMEAARVFIAEPLSLPLIWDNQKPWQEQQEHNLLYVALSRSTQDLFLIGDALWFDGNLQPQESSVEFPESYSTPNFNQLIAQASVEELFEYQESIQLELGKRIASKFQDLRSSDYQLLADS